jgi:hypothetical protein
MTSDEPTRCNVADMVCVVSATLCRHVGMSVVFGGKIPDKMPTLPAKPGEIMVL